MGRRKTDIEINKTEEKKSGPLGQNIGISLVVIAFVLATVVVNFSGQDCFTENILMILAMGIGVILTTLSYATIAIVLGAVSIVAYAGVKMYGILVAGNEMSTVSLLWIVLPIMAIGGIYLYVNSNSGLALANALLKKQIAELVMTDPLTGLYNLRSMFMDIQTQISYSERNNTAISLMIIRLRYPNELKRVLKQDEYERAIKQLSLLLVDTVRLEDKVYSIDKDGGFGIILTCDKEGTKIVEKRLRNKLEDPVWFEGVSAKNQVRIEVKVGYLQYDKIKYNRNAEIFKQDVEAEVEYDM